MYFITIVVFNPRHPWIYVNIHLNIYYIFHDNFQLLPFEYIIYLNTGGDVIKGKVCIISFHSYTHTPKNYKLYKQMISYQSS